MAVATHYEVLGVPPGASPEEIRAAYRRKAKELHPDVSPDPRAHERMAEVNGAFSVLIDPEKRAEYDAGIRAPKPKADPRGRDDRREEGRAWADTYRFIDSLGHERMGELFRRETELLQDPDLWRSLWTQAVQAQKAARMPFDVRLAYESAAARYRAVVSTEAGEDGHWIDGQGNRVAVATMSRRLIESELERLYKLREAQRAKLEYVERRDREKQALRRLIGREVEPSPVQVNTRRALELTDRNVATLETARSRAIASP